MKHLPIKPSTLIQLAVNSLKECENSRNFSIDMSVICKKHEGKFHVDLTGAVIATRFSEMLGKKLLCPQSFTGYREALLMSLEALSDYDVSRFLNLIVRANKRHKNYKYLRDIEGESFFIAHEILQGITQTGYHQSPEAFKNNMTLIANRLKEAGK